MRATTRFVRRAGAWCCDAAYIVYALAVLVVIGVFGSDAIGEEPDDADLELERLDTDYDPRPVPIEIDKGLTDNRDRYIAQSAATRDGIVAELDQAA